MSKRNQAFACLWPTGCVVLLALAQYLRYLGQVRIHLTWYQCTRHSFASHWVMDGRPIERLREILGHSTVKGMERYAHLRPDMFTEEDFEVVAVDLREPKVLRLNRERKGSA